MEPVPGEERDKLDEITLTGKLRQGGRLALERAIDRFTPHASVVVVWMLAGQGVREDVEELAADAFLALWAHAEEPSPEQGLRLWLGTVAQNRAADWLCTHKETAPLPEDAAVPGGADPQTEAERREWVVWLQDAVERLNELGCTSLLRYYCCDGKLGDIAHVLSLTQTAAKRQLFRGRKTLWNILTEEGVEAQETGCRSYGTAQYRWVCPIPRSTWRRSGGGSTPRWTPSPQKGEPI